MEYPGISEEIIEIVLTQPLRQLDLLPMMGDDELVVISQEVTINGILTKLVQEEVLRHKQFLCKYSQYFWGL